MNRRADRIPSAPLGRARGMVAENSENLEGAVPLQGELHTGSLKFLHSFTEAEVKKGIGTEKGKSRPSLQVAFTDTLYKVCGFNTLLGI